MITCSIYSNTYSVTYRKELGMSDKITVDIDPTSPLAPMLTSIVTAAFGSEEEQ